MDLDQDYTINGHVFKAGKDVTTEVQEPQDDGSTKTVDYADVIKDMMAASAEGKKFASTHHGAVANSKDPLEATDQTPTRPLTNQKKAR